ncbi:2OG-Fe dioxygenase family protein [Kitasatospora sp. NPDC049285]|uniref:2OG-Fe dioxygenase family protein n=1 Tax=Kitasatospora sp. NPDC049285 TaxID=3157096 RepID=UPI0034185A6F
MSADVQEKLRVKGYALVLADRLDIGEELRAFEEGLAKEWENLEVDGYLKGGARFRERRYDRFSFLPRTGEVTLQPHRPYFQSSTANPYAGGIQREVAGLTASTLDNPLLKSLIVFNFEQFPVAPELLDQHWEVACHQFRIIGSAAELGEPTPEGPHHDDVDFGAIHLMSRSNVAGGGSQVYDLSKELIAEFCLESRLDTMYWDDRRLLHAVHPITAADDREVAVRDVLILGYRHAPELGAPDAD